MGGLDCRTKIGDPANAGRWSAPAAWHPVSQLRRWAMVAREDLHRRIATHIALDPRVTERRMFGGICFLQDGKILVCVRGKGGLLVQCGAEAAETAIEETGVARMVMGGRPSANFVTVDNDSLETDEGVRHWIAMAERYLATLFQAEAGRRR